MIKKGIFLASFLLGTVSFAQSDGQIIVVRESVKTKKVRDDRNVENYDAFKFDPFRMGIGEIGFSYEHRIDEKASVEFELGPTVSNLWGNRFGVSSFSGVTVKQYSRMGLLGSVALRYYPIEEMWAMNKLYVGPKIKFRNYNTTYDALNIDLSSVQAKSQEWIFSFNIGYQQWLSNNFAFDYYCGIGIGSMNRNYFDLSSVYDGNTGNYTYSWIETKEQFARVLGVVGMKVTFGN